MHKFSNRFHLHKKNKNKIEKKSRDPRTCKFVYELVLELQLLPLRSCVFSPPPETVSIFAETQNAQTVTNFELMHFESCIFQHK